MTRNAEMTTSAQPLAYTTKQAAATLGCGETLIRRLIAERTIPHVRLGDRVVIPKASLETWLSSQAAASIKTAPFEVIS